MGFGRSRLDGQWGRHLEKEQIGDGEAQVEFGCAGEREPVRGLRYPGWRGGMRPQMGIQVEASATAEDAVTW